MSAPPRSADEVFGDLASHLYRVSAVLSHTIEGLPAAGEARETALSKLDHVAWLLGAAQELLDLATDDAQAFEPFFFRGTPGQGATR